MIEDGKKEKEASKEKEEALIKLDFKLFTLFGALFLIGIFLSYLFEWIELNTISEEQKIDACTKCVISVSRYVDNPIE